MKSQGKTIVFASNRGGVGKSTLSYHISHILAETNPVIFLDCTATQTRQSKHVENTCAIHVLESLSTPRSYRVAIFFLLIGLVWCLLVRDHAWVAQAGALVSVVASIVATLSQRPPRINLLDFLGTPSTDIGLHIIPSTGVIPRRFGTYRETAIASWQVPDRYVCVIDLDNALDDVAHFAVAVADVVVIPTSFSMADYKRLVHDPRNGSVLDLTRKLNKSIFVVFNRVSVHAKERPEYSDWEFTVSKSDHELRSEILALMEEDVEPDRLVGLAMMKEIPSSVQMHLDAGYPVTDRRNSAIADVAMNLSLITGKLHSTFGSLDRGRACL